jgi:hypothetical protein
MAYGKLSQILMGAPQMLGPVPPGGLRGGGSLAQLLTPGLDMGGGMGQGQFPTAPGSASPFTPEPFDLFAPENALPIAGQLLAGRSNAEGIGGAFTTGGELYGAHKGRNKALSELSSIDPQMARFAAAGAPLDKLWGATLKKQGMDGSTTYGKTPIYGTDPETGKTVLGTIGDDGTFKKIDTGGFDIGQGVDKIDLGTQWGLVNKRTGDLVGYMPKDVAGEAAQKEAGKGQGEALAAYQSMTAKMPGLEGVVRNLDSLSEQATYTWAGQMTDAARRQMGAEPRESAVARQTYISMVDNQILPLLRDTFGAQFTQKEGETLRATLGNPDLHPKEKQAVLKAFIEQKRRDVEALAAQTGAPVPPQAPSPDGGQVRRKYNPTTGRLE